MSTYPRLEARVSALERRQINTDTHIEEVTGEITASVKQLSEDMHASFKQLSEYLATTIEADITDIKKDVDNIKATMATKKDVDDIKKDVDNIKATMATKKDVDNIKKDVSDIKEEIATTNQNTMLLLTQILERLPK